MLVMKALCGRSPSETGFAYGTDDDLAATEADVYLVVQAGLSDEWIGLPTTFILAFGLAALWCLVGNRFHVTAKLLGRAKVEREVRVKSVVGPHDVPEFSELDSATL